MTRQEYRDIYDAVGVAMEVHNTMGRGMAEQIYQEAYAIEATMRGMDVEREKNCTCHTKELNCRKFSLQISTTKASLWNSNQWMSYVQNTVHNFSTICGLPNWTEVFSSISESPAYAPSVIYIFLPMTNSSCLHTITTSSTLQTDILS